MLKAGLHNMVKPTREETSYPAAIAQPIIATRKPPPTTSKYRVLGGVKKQNVEYYDFLMSRGAKVNIYDEKWYDGVTLPYR